MSQDAGPIERLVLELGRLPGIGGRTAQRLAHFIIRQSPKDSPHSMAHDLAAALRAVAEQVSLCARCRNLATQTLCAVCADPQRNQRLVCVVESVSDLDAIERLGSFDGVYFVLHGALSPLDAMGPQGLQLGVLRQRVEEGASEFILALNATLEGDTTALYLASLLADTRVKLTRLASGVPHGGELEYLDRATLGRALLERRSFEAAP